MAIFNSYVKLPEGTQVCVHLPYRPKDSKGVMTTETLKQPIWHFWMIHEAVLTNVSCRSEFMCFSWITRKGKPLPWKILKFIWLPDVKHLLKPIGHFQGWRLRMLCTITTNYLPRLIRANYSTSDMEFVRSLRCPGIQERNFVTDGIPHIRARDWGIEYVICIYIYIYILSNVYRMKIGSKVCDWGIYACGRMILHVLIIVLCGKSMLT